MRSSIKKRLTTNCCFNCWGFSVDCSSESDRSGLFWTQAKVCGLQKASNKSRSVVGFLEAQLETGPFYWTRIIAFEIDQDNFIFAPLLCWFYICFVIVLVVGLWLEVCYHKWDLEYAASASGQKLSRHSLIKRIVLDRFCSFCTFPLMFGNF